MSLVNEAVNVPSIVVAIPADLRRRLDLYITQCKYEISGLGTVEVNENGDLEVTELYLLDQVVSSGDTELPCESVAKFMAEAPERNRSQQSQAVVALTRDHVRLLESDRRGSHQFL